MDQPYICNYDPARRIDFRISDSDWNCLQRTFTIMNCRDVEALETTGCSTVREAIEKKGETAARRDLAKKLNLDGPEATLGYTAYYGPIEWTHNMPSVAVGLYKPGTSPRRPYNPAY